VPNFSLTSTQSFGVRKRRVSTSSPPEAIATTPTRSARRMTARVTARVERPRTDATLRREPMDSDLAAAGFPIAARETQKADILNES
jgi:hypothetical protein